MRRLGARSLTLACVAVYVKPIRASLESIGRLQALRLRLRRSDEHRAS